MLLFFYISELNISVYDLNSGNVLDYPYFKAFFPETALKLLIIFGFTLHFILKITKKIMITTCGIFLEKEINFPTNFAARVLLWKVCSHWRGKTNKQKKAQKNILTLTSSKDPLVLLSMEVWRLRTIFKNNFRALCCVTKIVRFYRKRLKEVSPDINCHFFYKSANSCLLN